MSDYSPPNLVSTNPFDDEEFVDNNPFKNCSNHQFEETTSVPLINVDTVPLVSKSTAKLIFS